MAKVGFQKAGVREWLGAIPGISKFTQNRVLRDNERMVRNLRSLGLPMDRDFGSFDTMEEASRAVPAKFKKDCLFIIRCPHRTNKELIERKLFVPWSEVEQFVRDLPGGYEHYELGVREVSKPLWSGNIRCSRTGRIEIELWKGKHLDRDVGGTEVVSYYGTHVPPQISFRWSDNCSVEVKDLMIGAFRFISPDLRFREAIFAEFNFTENGLRFIGASRDPFWTDSSM